MKTKTEFQELSEWLDANAEHLKTYTLDEIVALAKSCGFSVATVNQWKTHSRYEACQ